MRPPPPGPYSAPRSTTRNALREPCEHLEAKVETNVETGDCAPLCRPSRKPVARLRRESRRGQVAERSWGQVSRLDECKYLKENDKSGAKKHWRAAGGGPQAFKTATSDRGFSQGTTIAERVRIQEGLPIEYATPDGVVYRMRSNPRASPSANGSERKANRLSHHAVAPSAAPPELLRTNRSSRKRRSTPRIGLSVFPRPNATP